MSSFKCSKDSDIQDFLCNNAIPFEKAHKSRTYIILDPASIEKEELDILAYFSVAIDHLLIREKVSKSFKKKLNGIFSDDRVPCYLVGQLARNDSFSKEDIHGEEILDYAFNVLMDAHDLVGGRFVRVDCKDCEQIKAFYVNNHFTLLPDKEDHGLCQLVKFLPVKMKD